ncbi:hypothetical protein LZC95_15550 [Pendulispora brunnea]|uniref:Aconitase/3-isopropylmalate dehydratase large subunit alpha/beta/alpha domain-containing protein n=1 Tax=Pendulispora brunnea TaxID=2905690 RepID=A0ABZ2KMQ4_9BACT
MAEKILAGRAAGPARAKHEVDVKVDQVVLVRDPRRALAEGVAAGLKKASPEVSIAYDTVCVRDPSSPAPLATEALSHGLSVARAGAGFPAPVHLERFGSPARLAVTDEPRLAALGGVGMLTWAVPPAALGHALARGRVKLRPPRSIQVQLTGKLRPFVGARDVAFEWIRRDLAGIVQRVVASSESPVVLEFGGPGARFLSVAERAILCAVAPQVGAVGALFGSDERTEVFLRDERRSKAHRSLAPDAGAPFEEVVSLDLGAVDPLVRNVGSASSTGSIVPVRELAGKPVSQVLLGGDTGSTLRELFVVATLLKSKRVPKGLDFLLAAPSRQMLEVLAESGALADLIATGARLVEPDPRIATGLLYPPPGPGLSLTTCEPEGPANVVVASAETLAYAVATGKIGDPRAFKRPVRVTVPRVLPTDDVFVSR